MGAVLKNKERVAVIRILVMQGYGNPKCRIEVTHKQFNNISYQRLTLINPNVSNKERFKERLHAKFNDLVKIEGDFVLYFKYTI